MGGRNGDQLSHHHQRLLASRSPQIKKRKFNSQTAVGKRIPSLHKPPSQQQQQQQPQPQHNQQQHIPQQHTHLAQYKSQLQHINVEEDDTLQGQEEEPTPSLIDFSTFPDKFFYKYRRVYQMPVSGYSRSVLEEAVKYHFAEFPVDEEETIARFIYRQSHIRKVLKLDMRVSYL
ncbi:hypothetical protein BASA61_006699 [Batrachochytrium salamandrivorans]|nr:hypothetical protein BASA61_006699 [Batrachochytrium salamandrivorans]